VALLGVTWDFKAPMRPGDTIRALIAVTGKRPVKNPSLGLIELAIELTSQTGEILQSGSARLLLRKTRPPTAIWGQVDPGKTA
jgi:acyl dehydratase